MFGIKVNKTLIFGYLARLFKNIQIIAYRFFSKYNKETLEIFLQKGYLYRVPYVNLISFLRLKIEVCI
jgi:hypothetical protein